jgi:hypothetical protein
MYQCMGVIVCLVMFHLSCTFLDEKTQKYNCQVIHIKEHDTYKLYKLIHALPTILELGR